MHFKSECAQFEILLMRKLY